MTNIINVSKTAAALMLALGMANANADFSASGNFSAGGYAVVPFTVATSGIVDMTYTGGMSDPTFSLFDASGVHLVTNDDSNSLYSHLTQSLSAGSYSLLVSFCCQSVSYASINGAAYVSSDGFNFGSYWFGGTGSLTGMQAYLLGANAYYEGSPYALTITGAVPVPEPETYFMMLAGLGLVGAMARRRKLAKV